MFVLHRGESGVVMGVALSPFGGMLAAAGQSLALGLFLPVQREVVVPLSDASSLVQAPASSQQPSASSVPLGLPVRKTRARLRAREREMQRSTCARYDTLSAPGVSKLLLTDSPADLPVLLNTLLLLVF